jgi:hypothetical protein
MLPQGPSGWEDFIDQLQGILGPTSFGAQRLLRLKASRDTEAQKWEAMSMNVLSLALETVSRAPTCLTQAPGPLTKEQVEIAQGVRILKSRVVTSLMGRTLRKAPVETRKELEDKELRKWQDRLVQILVRVKAPIVENAPDRALKLLAGKSRAKTLRTGSWSWKSFWSI